MRIGLAFRVFFKALFDAQFAVRLADVLTGKAVTVALPTPEPRTPSPKKSVSPKPARNDAITLLATLQREARFVDMVQEPLGNYSDSQVGAAVRDVLRDCGKVLDRMFGLTPLVDQEEGSQVEVPVGFDASRYRLTGNVSGQPPFVGKLIHHGWRATRCEIPIWSGSEEAQRIVAPEEVEVQ